MRNNASLQRAVARAKAGPLATFSLKGLDARVFDGVLAAVTGSSPDERVCRLAKAVIEEKMAKGYVLSAETQELYALLEANGPVAAH